jgi:hypothetical protein
MKRRDELEISVVKFGRNHVVGLLCQIKDRFSNTDLMLLRTGPREVEWSP